ncbi:hypothetical protein V6N12_051605 [Hibiscus sabdariffa]|uniref:Uncharacterized protein n=1 Tax=Hibiscus sabdariffa TaxID=183260 RepID=A0ABR2GG22_9ROSI
MSVGTDRLGSTTEMGCCLKEETRLMGASEVNRRSNEDEVFEESDCGLRVPGRTPDPLLAPSNSLHLPFPLVALFSFCVSTLLGSPTNVLQVELAEFIKRFANGTYGFEYLQVQTDNV